MSLAKHLDMASTNFVDILGVKINPLKWSEIFELIDLAISEGGSETICCCTVHTVMETQKNTEYRKCIESASLRTTDGMPLFWLSHGSGFKYIDRICGPDLMLKLCEHSVLKGYKHYFYGGCEGVPKMLAERLQTDFPGLSVVGYYSPPFRELTPEEDKVMCQNISDSGAQIIWVGLGTPKQDIWMANHKGRLPCVMIGVGAAFNFHTGLVKRAPRWMSVIGMEWLYRLFSEPKRLWKRYLVYNILFIIKIILETFRILLKGRDL